jgi:hypothetical protein
VVVEAKSREGKNLKKCKKSVFKQAKEIIFFDRTGVHVY